MFKTQNGFKPFSAKGQRNPNARYVEIAREGHNLVAGEYTGSDRRNWLQGQIHAAIVEHCGGPVRVTHCATAKPALGCKHTTIVVEVVPV